MKIRKIIKIEDVKDASTIRLSCLLYDLAGIDKYTELKDAIRAELKLRDKRLKEWHDKLSKSL